MTNKEAVLSLLSKAQPDEDSTVFQLTVAGVDPNAQFTSANSQMIGGVAVDVLAGMLAAPSVSEGGYSQSYNVAGVKDLLLFLARKYGRQDIVVQLTPTISSSSPW